MALRFSELVAIVLEERAVVIEVRDYVYEISGLPAPSITRYQYQLEVLVRSAKTGELIAKNTFKGSMPAPCPEKAPASKTEIYGEHVSEWTVLDWISGFVNP